MICLSVNYTIYMGLELGICLFLNIFLKQSIKKRFLKYKYRGKETIKNQSISQ